MLACGPGEYHDLGLLMLAVALRADGWRVEYLGADTPADTAIEFAERIGATMLCFSAAREESVEALRDLARRTDEQTAVPIVIGGAAVEPRARARARRDLRQRKHHVCRRRGSAAWQRA